MPRKPTTPPDASTPGSASPEEKFEAFDARAEVLHEIAEAAANEEFETPEPALAAQAAGVWAHEAVEPSAQAEPQSAPEHLSNVTPEPPAAGQPLQRLMSGSLQFGRENVARMLETTQALARVRSPQEAFGIQARFAQDSAAATWRESLRVGALLQEAAMSGLAPLSRLMR
jgi:hypothetical protein